MPEEATVVEADNRQGAPPFDVEAASKMAAEAGSASARALVEELRREREAALSAPTPPKPLGDGLFVPPDMELDEDQTAVLKTLAPAIRATLTQHVSEATAEMRRQLAEYKERLEKSDQAYGPTIARMATDAEMGRLAESGRIKREFVQQAHDMLAKEAGAEYLDLKREGVANAVAMIAESLQRRTEAEAASKATAPEPETVKRLGGDKTYEKAVAVQQEFVAAGLQPPDIEAAARIAARREEDENA